MWHLGCVTPWASNSCASGIKYAPSYHLPAPPLLPSSPNCFSSSRGVNILCPRSYIAAAHDPQDPGSKLPHNSRNESPAAPLRRPVASAGLLPRLPATASWTAATAARQPAVPVSPAWRTASSGLSRTAPSALRRPASPALCRTAPSGLPAGPTGPSPAVPRPAAPAVPSPAVSPPAVPSSAVPSPAAVRRTWLPAAAAVRGTSCEFTCPSPAECRGHFD